MKSIHTMMILAFAVAAAFSEPIRLKDGSVIQGEILAHDDSTVTLRSPALGEVKIKLSMLEGAKREPVPASAEEPEATGPATARRGGDPSDQSLFFLPTAFTPPRGSFTFRDFELLFLTFGYAPTSSTSLTGGFLFPISAEFQLLTAGLKQTVWTHSQGHTAVALTGNITKPVGEFADDAGFLVNSNLVVSRRFTSVGASSESAAGLHAALGYLGVSGKDYDETDLRYETRWKDNFSYGIGWDQRLTGNAKFMMEYLSATPFDAAGDFDGGMLTVGFRLHGSRLAADIAGIRPIIDEDLGAFFLWPLLVVSYRF